MFLTGFKTADRKKFVPFYVIHYGAERTKSDYRDQILYSLQLLLNIYNCEKVNEYCSLPAVEWWVTSGGQDFLVKLRGTSVNYSILYACTLSVRVKLV